MKAILSKNKHALLLLYFPLYMAAFQYLEHFVPRRIHVIEFGLDCLIPFNEYFVIPYLLWFPFMGLFGTYFYLKDKEAFIKMMEIGMIGMTVFILVSFLYPNGLTIRPTTFAHDNLCTHLVKKLYATDPARNVFPSIHVYNSMVIAIVARHARSLEDHPLVQAGAESMTFLIVLATMFIKQHSVFDVVSGLLLVAISSQIVYNIAIKENEEMGTLHAQNHLHWSK